LAGRRRTRRLGVAAHAGDVVARRGTRGACAGNRSSTREVLDERPAPRHVHARCPQRIGHCADEGAAHGLTIRAIGDASVHEAEVPGAVGGEDGKPSARTRPGLTQAIRRRAARGGVKVEAHGASEAVRSAVRTSRTVRCVGSVGDGDQRPRPKRARASSWRCIQGRRPAIKRIRGEQRSRAYGTSPG
jgi:hypothetical protein